MSYGDLKDIERETENVEKAVSRIQDSLKSLDKSQNTDERIILFPDRRNIIAHQPTEESKNKLSRFAHLVDSTSDASMYKIRREDVWQAPQESLPDLFEDLRTVLRDESPNLEEWIERQWKKANQFTLRTHRDGYTVLKASDPSEMKDVARRKLEHNTHYTEHVSDTETRITKGAEAKIKQVLYDAGYPVQDLRELDSGEELSIALNVDLRDYQSTWVDRFSERGSGVFVGPPGSGKTVAALGVMDRICGETLILVPSRDLARQWKQELLDKTSLSKRQIGQYHGGEKRIRPVTIATYQSAGMSRHRKLFNKRKWGLIVYDEVHHIPSKIYKRTTNLQSKHRLGLSASPVREDKKEKEIFTLVGAPIGTDWASLFSDGVVQEPEIEIRYVPWSSERQRKRYRSAEGMKKLQVAGLNPGKIREVKEILDCHEGEKSLVFVEWLEQGEKYSEELGASFLSGETPHKQREQLLQDFKDGEITSLIVSRVGDEGIDLPDAEVAIAASGLGGSRRQGAQRAGRTMRPVGDSKMYLLATKGSSEQDFAQRQTQHLSEKGVSVKEIDSTE